MVMPDEGTAVGSWMFHFVFTKVYWLNEALCILHFHGHARISSGMQLSSISGSGLA